MFIPAIDAPNHPRRSFRGTIVRALRWLIEKLGGEGDTELRARVLNMYARSRISGTRESFERAVSAVAPLGTDLEFIWDSPVYRGDSTLFVVVFK